MMMRQLLHFLLRALRVLARRFGDTVLMRHKVTLCVFLLVLVFNRYKQSALRLHFKKSLKSVSLVQKARLEQMVFRPSVLFSGNHAQSLLPLVLAPLTARFDLGYTLQREMLPLADGGEIALDWAVPHEVDDLVELKDLPVLALVPGISGEHFDLYMRSTIAEGVRAGYCVVAVNHRGARNTELLTPRLYHAGMTDDLREAVEYIREQHRGRDIFLSGFSMGANMVAKYLGEEGGRSRVKGAVCISPPFDLDLVAKHIEDYLFGFYHYAIAIPFKARYRRNREML